MTIITSLPLDQIIIGERHRRELGDIDGLAASIAEVGLLHPVVVGLDKMLIAGERRLAAAKQLGWSTIPVHVVRLDQIARGEFAENTQRKDFTLSEAVAIKRALEPLEKAAAKDRQREGGRRGGQGSGKLPEASKGNAADKAANATGMARRTLEKAEAVVEAAEAEPERFGKLLEDMDHTGRAHGPYQRLQAARAIMASREEPGDSLDFFPTPPFATRAMIDHVLPALGIAPSDLAGMTVWEHACGEGHMAEPLAEYFGHVIATDVHPYGYGETLDFLDETSKRDCDWGITNPPFGDKSVRFVLKALNVARVGVAMFVRLQWLESIERYELIFRDHPPTLVAFFVERVNLCKGRWEPDGTTATAYCWLVWVHGEAPRPPFWIPPGCRERLTHADDVARFTTHPVTRRAPPPAPADDVLQAQQYAPPADPADPGPIPECLLRSAP